MSSLETLTQSSRRRVVALQLAVFLGVFGAHRWYLGKPRSALLQAICCGGLGLWWLYDVYRLGFSQVVDGDGQPLDPPVFRNLGREEQERIADEIIAEEAAADRRRFDDELESALEDDNVILENEVEVGEPETANVGE